MTEFDPFQIGNHLDDALPVEAVRYLGPKSKDTLNAIGIHTVGELKNAGVIDTYLRIKQAGFPASLNFVWAMYAGLMGVDFHRVPSEFKEAVKAEIKRAG
ncbi:MAG: TfoX/Sxy family DNA transformation protein [Alphaproteobacteria bacterium]|nr:TfoX/Sxy family DNA transformation protein [Alphaproteobacteria bacterium]